MSLILYIIIFIFVLGIVILIHEFGHFLFARRAGILCHEFSIGMGPAIYKIKRGETTFAIRAIPLGGYVSMAGEEPETDKLKRDEIIYLKFLGNKVNRIYLYKPDEDNVTYAKVVDYDLYGKDGNPLYIHYEDENGQTHHATVAKDAFYHFNKKQEQQIAPYDRCFESKSWINRFLTVIAGAMFNFLLAVVVFIIVNLISGIPTNKPIIGEVTNGSPAQTIGLQSNDKITHMSDNTQDVNITSWDDITNFMSNYDSGQIQMNVIRDGKQMTLITTPQIYIQTLGLFSANNLNSTEITQVGDNSPAYKALSKMAEDNPSYKEGIDNILAGKPNQDFHLSIVNISGTQADDLDTPQNETHEWTFNNVKNWYEVRTDLAKFYLGEKVNITFAVQKGDTTSTFTESMNAIKAIAPSNVSRVMVGINPKTEFNLFKSIEYGFTDTANVIGSVFQTLGLLFNNNNVGVKDLSGPVGIYDMTKTFAMEGFVALLGWVAFISANIGFVNLLPLPALDGGRMLFLLIEGVVRKPINRKIEGYIHTVGFILFLMLFLFITFNDILRIRG